MKEITAELIKSFIKSNNIPFYATQPKICVPIVARICQKMAHGIRFDDIKVCDNLIIDGHHRYLSAQIMNFNIGYVISNATSITNKIAWEAVAFDDEDWDTPAKIAYLNELDAKYNQLTIEFISRIASV